MRAFNYYVVLLSLLLSAAKADGIWGGFKSAVNEGSEMAKGFVSPNSWAGYFSSYLGTSVPKHATKDEVTLKRTNPKALFAEASHNLLLIFEQDADANKPGFNIDDFDFIFKSSGSLIYETQSCAWMSHLVKAAYKCGKVEFCEAFIKKWAEALWWRTRIGFGDDSVRSAHWTVRLAWILEEFQIHFHGQPVMGNLAELILDIWEAYVKQNLQMPFDGIRTESIVTHLEVIIFKMPNVFGFFLQRAWDKFKHRLTFEERKAFIDVLLKRPELKMSNEAADMVLGIHGEDWQKVVDYICNSGLGNDKPRNDLLRRYISHEPKPRNKGWMSMFRRSASIKAVEAPNVPVPDAESDSDEEVQVVSVLKEETDRSGVPYEPTKVDPPLLTEDSASLTDDFALLTEDPASLTEDSALLTKVDAVLLTEVDAVPLTEDSVLLTKVDSVLTTEEAMASIPSTHLPKKSNEDNSEFWNSDKITVVVLAAIIVIFLIIFLRLLMINGRNNRSL
jgi:hypothetical protein